MFFNSSFIISAVLLLVGARHSLRTANTAWITISYTNLILLVCFYMPIFTLGFMHIEQLKAVVAAGSCALNAGLVLSFLLIYITKRGLPGSCAVHRSRNVDSLIGNAVVPRTVQRYFVVDMWIAAYLFGVFLYGILFVAFGIPLFTDDIGIARAAFASGHGFVLLPANVLLTLPPLIFYARRRNKYALLTAVCTGALAALSGWRGNIVILMVSFAILSIYLRRFTFRGVLLVLVGLLIVALIGIYRSEAMGEGIYGIQFARHAGILKYIEYAALYVDGRIAETVYNLDRAIGAFASAPMYGHAALMDLSALVPRHGDTVAEMMKNRFGHWVGGGGMPVSIFGQGFIDFGVAGVFAFCLVYAFAYGLLIRYVDGRLEGGASMRAALASILQALWFYAIFGSFLAQFLKYAIAYIIMTGVLYVVRAAARRRTIDAVISCHDLKRCNSPYDARCVVVGAPKPDGLV